MNSVTVAKRITVQAASACRSPSLSTQCRRCYSEQAGTSQTEVDRARAYCTEMLRRYDAPSYTLSTFIPPAAQDAYLALRAFNIDVSRVADVTSNPAVGAMRMQYWRDSVTRALAGAPPQEPVAVLLAHAAALLSDRTDGKSRLSKSWLHRVISTRETYLHNRPYPDLAALESYAENTYSTILYLTLAAFPLTSISADHVASHIGKAQGIAAILRGLPLLATPPPPNHHSNTGALGGQGGFSSTQQGAVLLPLDVMAEAGVREEEVLRKGAEAPGLRDAVFAVATRANDHLITAREMLKNLYAGRDAGHEFEHADDAEHRDSIVPGHEKQAPSADVERGFGVFMPAVSTQMWLDQLQKCEFDVFNPKLRTTDWKLPWKAYWAFKRRKL